MGTPQVEPAGTIASHPAVVKLTRNTATEKKNTRNAKFENTDHSEAHEEVEDLDRIHGRHSNLGWYCQWS